MNQNDLDGVTPLLHAIKKKHDRCAELLVAAGADVKLSDWDSKTPLFWATVKKQR